MPQDGKIPSLCGSCKVEAWSEVQSGVQVLLLFEGAPDCTEYVIEKALLDRGRELFSSQEDLIVGHDLDLPCETKMQEHWHKGQSEDHRPDFSPVIEKGTGIEVESLELGGEAGGNQQVLGESPTSGTPAPMQPLPPARPNGR